MTRQVIAVATLPVAQAFHKLQDRAPDWFVGEWCVHHSGARRASTQVQRRGSRGLGGVQAAWDAAFDGAARGVHQRAQKSLPRIKMEGEEVPMPIRTQARTGQMVALMWLFAAAGAHGGESVSPRKTDQLYCGVTDSTVPSGGEMYCGVVEPVPRPAPPRPPVLMTPGVPPPTGPGIPVGGPSKPSRKPVRVSWFRASLLALARLLRWN
jgi:hypothetical protein